MTERRPQTEAELVEFVRAIDVPAPHSLHREVEALIAGRSQPAIRGAATGGRGARSPGSRTDRVGGRAVTTVFYADAGGRRIGYAIVAGTPAPRSTGGAIAWRKKTPYRLLTENGTAVVTWLRDGHLCVVSGRGVSSATLLRLASWGNGRAGA